MEEKYRKIVLYGTAFALIFWGLWQSQKDINNMLDVVIGVIWLIFLTRYVLDPQWIYDAYTLEKIAFLIPHGVSLGLKDPDLLEEDSINHQIIPNKNIPGGRIALVQMDMNGDGLIYHLALRPIPRTTNNLEEIVRLVKINSDYDPIYTFLNPNLESRSTPQVREIMEWQGYKNIDFTDLDQDAQNSVMEELFRRKVNTMLNDGTDK